MLTIMRRGMLRRVPLLQSDDGTKGWFTGTHGVLAWYSGAVV